MRIEKISLTNWRSIKEAEVKVRDFLMLTGKNNHGKSNVLLSILFFFGRRPADKHDFFNGTESLSVSIRFNELTPQEQKLFQVTGDHAVITKTVTLVECQETFFCGNTPLTDEAQSYLTERYAELIYIPASRQSLETLTRNGETPYQQLLRVMAAAALHSPLAITGEENATSFPPEDNTAKLGIITHALSEEMFDWGVEVVFPEGAKQEALTIELKVRDDAAADLARKGHGFQRAIFFAIIRAWAKLLESGFRLSAQEIPQEIILLYEEPELFLHPQAQRELLSCLKTLSENGVRIMLTTHSSFFVDLSRYQSICIVTRNEYEEGTRVQQATEELFFQHEEVRNFNMSYWINPDRGELFFARKVILVEGPTEKVILPKLAKKAGVFHHEDTVIDCGGKSNMPSYIALLNRFRIPYVVAYDSDQHRYRNRHSRDTARMHSEMIERHIDRTLGDTVVFENDIEDELALMDAERKHKPFTALQYISSEEFELTGSLLRKLLKLYQ